MRSPLIAFSLVAAAVSPSLAAAHPSSPKLGRSVAHPHVTEGDNGSPGPLRFKRSGVNGLGLNKLIGSGNPIDTILPQGAPSPSPPNTGTQPGSDNPLASEDLPGVPDTSNPAAVIPASVPSPAAAVPSSALGNVPATPATPATPAEPASPANPYENGQPGASNDMVSSEHVPNSEYSVLGPISSLTCLQGQKLRKCLGLEAKLGEGNAERACTPTLTMKEAQSRCGTDPLYDDETALLPCNSSAG